MRGTLRALAVATIMVAAMVEPASTQSEITSVSIEDIKEACLVGGSDDACIAVVGLYISELKASGQAPDVVDDLIAQIAVELGGQASGLPPVVRARVAEAIRVAAAEITDPDRAERLLVAAANVEAGVDLTSGDVAASPA